MLSDFWYKFCMESYLKRLCMNIKRNENLFWLPIEDPWIHEYLLSRHLLFFQTFIYCHSFESFEELRKSCVFAIKIPRDYIVFYGAFFVEVWKPLSSNFIANLNPLFEWNKNRRNKIRASQENEIKIAIFSNIDIDFLRFPNQFIYCECIKYS